MKKIKVAVIGCGRIANSAHIPAYMSNENAEIKYFCDIIPEKAEKAVNEYKCGIAITDYHVALNDPEIDAVSVCAHTNMHYQVSIDAMRAGKDVLSEKPVARTYKEAEEMLKVQKETGRLLAIGVCTRYHYQVNKVREMIAAGELGEVYHAHCSFRTGDHGIPGLGGEFTTKAISGGGVLIDHGVHFLDQLLYMIGNPELKSVTGKAYSKIGTPMKDYQYKIGSMWAEDTKDVENGTFDVDDFVTGFIQTKNGPTISFNGAWAQNIFEDDRYIDFLGTKAGVRLQYCGNYKLYYYKDNEKVTVDGEEKETLPIHTEEVYDFIDAVINKKPVRNDISDLMNTAKLLQAIYDSSDSGKEIVF